MDKPHAHAHAHVTHQHGAHYGARISRSRWRPSVAAAAPQAAVRARHVARAGRHGR